MKRTHAAGLLTLIALIAAPRVTVAQASPSPSPSPSAIDDTMEAGEADAQAPKRKLVKWNEYDGRLFTFRLGGEVMFEYADFAQDDNSRQQFDLAPEAKVRDARFLLTGRLKFKRPVSWTAGIMYDGPSDSYLVRETGIMVAVPEILGHVFVGRTKEGFSLNKVMSGAAGWTMERAPISDATLPILADGIKWLGYAPKAHLIWNLGYYVDWLSEGQSFSTYEHQALGRLAWVPIVEDTGGKLLHIGASGRIGKVKDGTIKMRSRPEAFPAPYFLDTGDFAATETSMLQVEAYYRPGPLLFGTEYFWQNADAPADGNPRFHGGDVVLTWLVTGETRPYNTRGGFFGFVSPSRTVFGGGPGAWEVVTRFSYTDLVGGTRQGGKFWRFTPMVNWYLSDNVRLELAYGYGSLDRFNITGKTQFFQTRLQLLI